MDGRVYSKLVRRKREGESFTKLIERLVEADMESGSCADAVREAAAVWGTVPAAGEVDVMERVVEENRKRADVGVEELA